ncbi:MAG TPA: hypothetical protein VN888_09105 [Mycobacterium sp.]|nr:hypothetical protein [Mycobacterium sp.]
MVSTRSRCLGGCALAIMVVLLVGCTRVILGTVHPVAPDAEPAPIRVADLLIEPGQFPARYPAVVLDATAVYRALQDVDGVAAASVVNPPRCAPPPRAPQDTAALQGIDSQDASSLIVTVTRPGAPLRARAEQLTACPSFTAVRGHDTSAVTVTVLPAPPVDAEDSYALDQTVTAEPSGSMRRTLTLAAQIGDVRVSATWLHDGTPETTPDITPDTQAPDTQALDTLFTDAVLKVRRVGGP